ncbi:biogenesis of lysosome-related organelles complex 1 subunit 4 [Euwallacea similis]|uniref:biogenesis of lysosome-related organelles complex 1 subunit 4 n=1 Tax=Euwallacea similis TaxID=1736056 RepID=UPI00344CDB5B
MDQNTLQKTAQDYSKFITNTSIDKKLEPINTRIEDLLARMEEFETMFTFIQPDVKDSRDMLKSILDYKPEFEDLCEKIDCTIFLIAHIKNNLDSLEARIEEEEVRLGVEGTSSKVTERVTSMLTPLFVSYC